MNEQTSSASVGYPIGQEISQERLDAEADLLDRVNRRPFLFRLPTYFRLGGPGFMGAAATLGAGTLTSAMLAGAQFGYKTLWIGWVAIGSGLFMMAAMARFATKGGFPIIKKQRERHGIFVAAVLTALIGLSFVGIAFNFGQVALGAHLIESIGDAAGVRLPKEYNWILYGAVTAWISLSYGRSGRGVALAENFMKLCLLVMIVCFAACLVLVGVDWPAAAKGFFVPWLPRGAAGVDLFIASTAAAIGVADWVFFQYAGLIKGWGPKHEGLARADIGMGFAAPFIVVYVVVVCLFAGTFYAEGAASPETAVELSAALTPLLGERVAVFAFLFGFLAVPISTSVIMGIMTAIGIHEAFGWCPDVRSPRWIACVLAPQIGLLGAFAPSPLFLIVVIAAFLSLTNNIVGWSFYLLLNDKSVLGENRCRSRFWNIGILTQVTLLNCIAILYVFNRMGLWE